MRPLVDEEKDLIYGQEFDGIKLPYHKYSFIHKEGGEPSISKAIMARFSQVTTVEPNMLVIGDFKKIVWKKSAELDSEGSFTIKLDSDFVIDCLFKASNKNGSIQIDKLYIANRKDPKSFKKAICIIDRTKQNKVGK